MKPPPETVQTTRASLELLYEVSREFAAALDLRTVLHRVLFLSMKYIGAVSGSIIVLDSHAQPVESAFLIRGKTTDQSTLQLRITYERGLAGWVARNRTAVLVPDTSKDERWLRLPDDEVGRTGAKSAVSVPILIRDDLVGVITLVHPTPGMFTPEHLDLVKAIADQTGIFILNARLYSESQRLREDLTAMIYHDIRSPLANITSSLEELGLLTGEGNPEVNSLLSIAMRSTDRIQRLTDTLLDIHRLEDGQIIVDRHLTSPKSLIEDSLGVILPLALSRQLVFIRQISPEIPDINVNPDMLRRVLINLLENAVKYSPLGETITIGASQEDKQIRFWVEDAGPGVPLSDQEKIFNKFTRLGSIEGSKGFGLGLAYCRLAVIGHGGCIWVESNAGKGSRFNFTIPMDIIID